MAVIIVIYNLYPRESKQQETLRFAHNFAKYCPIFKIISPAVSTVTV